jgi:hypothetical protein
VFPCYFLGKILNFILNITVSVPYYPLFSTLIFVFSVTLCSARPCFRLGLLYTPCKEMTSNEET